MSATIKSIQSGQQTVGATSPQNVTITSVDTSKSFVRFTARRGNSTPTDFNVSGDLTSSTNIRFERASGYDTGESIVIEWVVYEFDSGLSAQRGVDTSIGSTNTITISSVDTGESFGVTWCNNNGTAFGSDDWLKHEITGATTLALQVYSGTQSAQVYWWVAEWDSASVQVISKTFSSGSSTTSTITGVTLADSFLAFSSNSQDNLVCTEWPRVRLTGTTTLTYDKHGSPSKTNNMVTYVVETSDVTAQRGEEAFSTSDTSKNVTISSVDTDYTGSWTNAFCDRFTGSDDNVSETKNGTFTTDITGATTLNIQRYQSDSAAADVSWELIEFAAPDESVNDCMPMFFA